MKLDSVPNSIFGSLKGYKPRLLTSHPLLKQSLYGDPSPHLRVPPSLDVRFSMP